MVQVFRARLIEVLFVDSVELENLRKRFLEFSGVDRVGDELDLCQHVGLRDHRDEIVLRAEHVIVQI